MRKLILMALTIPLAGCVTHQQYAQRLDTWIGQPAGELIEALGYPSSTIEAPDGSPVYIYSTARSYTTAKGEYKAADGVHNIAEWGGETYHKTCQTFFRLDPDGLIADWQYRGNDCKGEYPEHK